MAEPQARINRAGLMGILLKPFTLVESARPATKPVGGLRQRIGIGHDPRNHNIDGRAEPVGEFRIDARIILMSSLILANSHILETNVRCVSLSLHVPKD